MTYLRENLSYDAANNAFVYKWTHVPTGKWYIGSRTAKNCHINDGYICSSKIVKPMIQESENEWVREIIATGDPRDMLNFEAIVLNSLDAKNDIMSFNMHNGDGKFTTLGAIVSEDTKKKLSLAKKGVPKSDEHKRKIGDLHRGKIVSDETRKLIGNSSRGRLQSATARLKNSVAHHGSKNAMYGKTHSDKTKQLMSINRKKASIEKVTPLIGYWVSPDGERFVKSADAHKAYPNVNVNVGTLRKWCHDNKNGWSFEPLQNKKEGKIK